MNKNDLLGTVGLSSCSEYVTPPGIHIELKLKNLRLDTEDLKASKERQEMEQDTIVTHCEEDFIHSILAEVMVVNCYHQRGGCRCLIGSMTGNRSDY